MKFVLAIALSITALTASARESGSEMIIETILNEAGEEVTVASCTCYRGPGRGQPYSCEPVAKTCYGGPGNYPYTCYVCPQ